MRRFLALAMFAAFGLVISLLMVGVGAYDAHAYRVGTPTTATIEQCTQESRGTDETCTATWSIDGKSHTGPIETGGAGYPRGTSLDVRVHGGSAYTGGAASTNFRAGTGVAVLTIVLTAFLAFLVRWSIRRSRKSTGNGP